MMKILIHLIAIFIVFISSGCNQNSDEVVVHTSVDQKFSEPVLKEYEKETGIRVKAVYDTEETKSTGVLNRLIAEKELDFSGSGSLAAFYSV